MDESGEETTALELIERKNTETEFTSLKKAEKKEHVNNIDL